MPSPHAAADIDLQTLTAVEWYQECKATGQFPRDEVSRQLAGRLLRVDEETQRIREDRRFARLTQAVMLGAVGQGNRPIRRR